MLFLFLVYCVGFYRTKYAILSFNAKTIDSLGITVYECKKKL
jgi:hypothetical protein